MKSKQLSNKLSLKKTTITNLDHTQMLEARGGAEITDLGCVPTGRTYCISHCVETFCCIPKTDFPSCDG